MKLKTISRLVGLLQRIDFTCLVAALHLKAALQIFPVGLLDGIPEAKETAVLGMSLKRSLTFVYSFQLTGAPNAWHIYPPQANEGFG